jgi:hypothetical protein
MTTDRHTASAATRRWPVVLLGVALIVATTVMFLASTARGSKTVLAVLLVLLLTVWLPAAAAGRIAFRSWSRPDVRTPGERSAISGLGSALGIVCGGLLESESWAIRLPTVMVAALATSGCVALVVSWRTFRRSRPSAVDVGASDEPGTDR